LHIARPVAWRGDDLESRLADAVLDAHLTPLSTALHQLTNVSPELLRGNGVDPDRFRTLAAELTPGRLADSQGSLELVSYRAAGRRGDITTYFRFPVYEEMAARSATGRNRP